MKNLKNQLFVHFIAFFSIFLFCANICAQTSVTKTEIVNGSDLTDTQGNIINAHGGGLLKVGKYYYWIGENRRKGVFVSCYRSTDLMNWEFRGDLLTRQSHKELDKANIERPKVIYNENKSNS